MTRSGRLQYPAEKSAGSGSRRSSPFLGISFRICGFCRCQNGRARWHSEALAFSAPCLKSLWQLDFGASQPVELAIGARLAFLIRVTVEIVDVAACDWHLSA